MSKRLIWALMFSAAGTARVVAGAGSADYLRAARTLAEMGEWSEAALYLQEAVAVDPECASCRQLLEECRRRMEPVEVAPQAAASSSARIKDTPPTAATEAARAPEVGSGRACAWGLIAGWPSGANFSKYALENALVAITIGTRFDQQIALQTDIYAIFPLRRGGAARLGVGIGWCMLAGGDEPVGFNDEGKVVKRARATRSGPHLPLVLSWRHGGAREYFLQSGCFVEIYPQINCRPEFGLGMRWYYQRTEKTEKTGDGL